VSAACRLVGGGRARVAVLIEDKGKSFAHETFCAGLQPVSRPDSRKVGVGNLFARVEFRRIEARKPRRSVGHDYGK